MKEYICNYALIRFLPYRDAGEFVNIGVALACEELGLLDFRLEFQDSPRVAGFFPEMDMALFRDGLNSLKNECERWRDSLDHISETPNGEKSRLMGHIFGELARPQQSVFHFSKPRTLLSANPETSLDNLFERYVHHEHPSTSSNGHNLPRP